MKPELREALERLNDRLEALDKAVDGHLKKRAALGAVSVGSVASDVGAKPVRSSLIERLDTAIDEIEDVLDDVSGEDSERAEPANS
ncbi:MAG: hypothetical protein Alpg2KO_23280 [Alphaproteobacteria bacterium]